MTDAHDITRRDITKAVSRRVQRSSLADVVQSRPDDLRTRVLVYMALLGNIGLDVTREAVKLVAAFDAIITPAEDKTEFERGPVPGCRAIDALIDNLVEEGILNQPDLIQSRESFYEHYKVRWTPWGFYLWCFVEGLVDSRNSQPSVCSIFFARDCATVLEQCSPYCAWLKGDGLLGDFCRIADFHKLLDGLADDPDDDLAAEKRLPIWKTAIYAHYLTVLAAKVTETGREFGEILYRQRLRELTQMTGRAADGRGINYVFFRDDTVVGTARSYDDEIDDFICWDDQYAEVMFRHIQAKDVYLVRPKLAAAYPAVMETNADHMTQGRYEKWYRMHRIHWGSVTPRAAG